MCSMLLIVILFILNNTQDKDYFFNLDIKILKDWDPDVPKGQLEKIHKLFLDPYLKGVYEVLLSFSFCEGLNKILLS